MKKWTVLVMPHDQGNTRTLHLYSGQIWTLVLVLVGLTFISAFMFGRYRVARAETEHFKNLNLELQTEVSKQAPESGLTSDEKTRIEEKIREEFGAKDSRIEQELSELYDLEKQVRQIHGLAPKASTGTAVASGPTGKGGKGGGISDSDPADPMVMYASMIDDGSGLPAPPTVIYGMADPPADLLVQEINIRKASLRQLVDALDARKDEVERTPSVWPTNHPRAYISSTFGNRIDPISRDIRHHDGVDFPAPYGTTARATARGTVKEAYFDRWFGNLVKIDHGDGLETWYAHLSKLSVEAGQQIQRGDKIGEVGSTGRSTGSHIHYEVHKNGKRVDPMKYLGN